MIAKIIGQLVETKEHSLVINAGGICYEVIVPASVLARLDETKDINGNICLITHHYFQIGPGSGQPVLVGFINEIERDFFLEFIKVSGIGPKAAVKAINCPISQISRAIDEGDMAFLKTLPGIGLQRAKDIIAKLQGKVGKFGLIQDRKQSAVQTKFEPAGWQEEALSVLLQLQYKRPEALEMIEKALKRSSAISSAEELLNEIYKQRMKV